MGPRSEMAYDGYIRIPDYGSILGAHGLGLNTVVPDS